MVESGRSQHIILFSRSGKNTELSSLATTSACVSAGQMNFASSSDHAMMQCFDNCGKSHPALHALVHASGVLEDGLIENQTAGAFRRVFASKASIQVYCVNTSMQNCGMISEV